MPPLTPEQTRTRASLAAHEKWARTPDRQAATQAARDGRWARYLERARELQGPDATPEAVERAAEHLRQADMARMSLKATKARARKSEAELAAEQAAVDRLADELENGAGDA